MRPLAKLAQSCSVELSEPAFELPPDADETSAKPVDHFRDYRACADSLAMHHCLNCLRARHPAQTERDFDADEVLAALVVDQCDEVCWLKARLRAAGTA